MQTIRLVTSALLTLTVTGVSSASVAAADVDASLRAQLERIAQRRVFFGHQSVGANLIDGVKQLATMTGVPIRVVEVATASEVPPAALGHTFVAENGHPLQKLQSFEHAFGQQPAGLDIAMVKFCFVDITADTDVKALFARYRTTIASLQAKNPGTTFVHVTAPLTVVQSGLKGNLKKLLGRAPRGTMENLRREDYNALLRQTYQGREPVFDLARAESTAPDGTTVSVEWNGRVAPALAAVYSDDGGHLNAAGKLHVARELVATLAAIPDRPAVNGHAR